MIFRISHSPLVFHRLIRWGLLLLLVGGLSGCATHQQESLQSGNFAPPHSIGPDMGPADRPLLLAQTDQTDTPQNNEEDPFADPADDEELDYLEDLEDDQAPTLVADPLEGWNRMMFQVNDRLYFWLLKPVAQGYRWVVPTMARVGIKNFFYNLGMPVRLANNLLQGRPKAAGAELGRFVVNTTEGMLGFRDPASRYPELVVPVEDLGQTFGRYGIGNGFYLVWPLLGASTFRDTLGRVGDFFMDPINYIDAVDPEIELGLTGLDVVNGTSFRIGDYEALKKAALDPYDALRNGYVQRRNRQIQE